MSVSEEVPQAMGKNEVRVLKRLLSTEERDFPSFPKWFLLLWRFQSGGYSPPLPALPQVQCQLAAASPEEGALGVGMGKQEGGASLSISSLSLLPTAGVANRGIPCLLAIRSFCFLCLAKSPRRSPGVSSIMASCQNTVSPAEGRRVVLKGFQHKEEEPDYIWTKWLLLARRDINLEMNFLEAVAGSSCLDTWKERSGTIMSNARWALEGRTER